MRVPPSSQPSFSSSSYPIYHPHHLPLHRPHLLPSLGQESVRRWKQQQASKVRCPHLLLFWQTLGLSFLPMVYMLKRENVQIHELHTFSRSFFNFSFSFFDNTRPSVGASSSSSFWGSGAGAGVTAAGVAGTGVVSLAAAEIKSVMKY